uniref:Uncharacterized protein n=1 Tax=Anguilla anguilla TaxID=7936 RepID=A0A0E9TMB7_ANGAN
MNSHLPLQFCFYNTLVLSFLGFQCNILTLTCLLKVSRHHDIFT